MKHKRYYNAFTIIELIVVVSIVAVLAGLTIFAFGSWRQRTATTEMKNELHAVSTTLKNYQNFNNTYPASLSALTYSTNTNVNVTYTLRSGGASYCLEAASTSVPTAAHWYIDSALGTTPVSTACS